MFEVTTLEPSQEASDFNRIMDNGSTFAEVALEPKTTKHAYTAQERQEKLETLATYSPEVLSKTTVKELRKLSSGLLNNVNSLGKTQLVLTILELTKETREAIAEQRRLDVLKKEATALELLAATKEPTAKAIRETHKASFNYITPVKHAKNITDKLYDIVSNDRIDNSARLLNIGVLAQDWLETMLRRGELTSVRSNVSDVRKALDEELCSRSDSLHQEKLKEAVAAFKQAMSIKFQPYQEAYNASRRSTTADKARNQVDVNGKAILAKATNILERIKKGEPIDAYNTGLALAAVTGRRLSEVFGRATEFTVIDNNTVSFKGQLKARNDALRKDLAFDIPVLVDSDLVITALTYLRTLKDKSGNTIILEDPEAIKRKHGKPVSRTVETYGWKVECKELTFKTLRDVYAILCEEKYKDHESHKGLAPNAYIARILGHSEGSVDVATVYQKYRLVQDNLSQL